MAIAHYVSRNACSRIRSRRRPARSLPASDVSIRSFLVRSRAMLNVFARSQKSASRPETLAVVDLGSNSFRLEIGRVEGDQIFRLARNASTFLPQAEAALGFPIDIIGGHEEARLIYLGVAHVLPASDDPRL